jgi:hypothetical protein
MFKNAFIGKTVKVPNFVQSSVYVYCGHSVVDWKILNGILLWNGSKVGNMLVILAPSSTTDPFSMQM